MTECTIHVHRVSIFSKYVLLNEQKSGNCKHNTYIRTYTATEEIKKRRKNEMKETMTKCVYDSYKYFMSQNESPVKNSYI